MHVNLKEVIEVVLVHDFHQTLKCLASVGTVGSIPSVIRRPRVREGRTSRVAGLLEKIMCCGQIRRAEQWVMMATDVVVPVGH